MIWVPTGKGDQVFASLVLTVAVMTGLDRYVLPPGWLLRPVSLASVSIGLFLVLLGLFAHLNPRGLVLERQTGREFVRRPVRSVFSIRVEYWGVFFLVMGVLLQSIPAPRGAP